MSAIEQTVLSSITREIAALPGQVGFYYKNLATGHTAGYRAEEAFLAASVIKFPLYLHVLTLAHLGNLSMSDKLTTLEEDKVPSCGALTLFSGEVTCDIATLCRLMIAISDNTATNRLIRHLGIEEINRGFAEMGLTKTVLRRKLFDTAASAQGIQNTICPREMGDLLESLYRGTFLSPALSQEAINTLLFSRSATSWTESSASVIPSPTNPARTTVSPTTWVSSLHPLPSFSVLPVTTPMFTVSRT